MQSRFPASPSARRGRSFVTCAPVLAWALACAVMAPWMAQAEDSPTREASLATMRRATAFMMDKVSNRGGFVWSYLPDMSRRWGELEARETMIWMQSPGTSTVGHLLLDAYHATGDEFFYEAATKVAGALMAVQLDCGGWNYVADFSGEESLREWYATVGRNAWRLEEFHHYYGNATFDDRVTSEAAGMLLRIFLEKRDPAFRPALDRAIGFVLASQHPSGGWPQRYPPREAFTPEGRPDYTGYLTFNDDVAAESIEFLILCHRGLGDDRVLDPIRRGMDFFVAAQFPRPQAGWALQYTHDMQPAAARSYEPRALMTQTTAGNIRRLLDFYRLTGDARLIARIPEALEWLEGCRLAPGAGPENSTHPTFIEIETGRPLFLHRTGSNVRNGRYFVDHAPANTVAHYSSYRQIDLEELRSAYMAALELSAAELAAASPLQTGRKPQPFPGYFVVDDSVNDNPGGSMDRTMRFVEPAGRAVRTLNAEGWWPSPLGSTSHPYRDSGDSDDLRESGGDYSRTLVGDDTDTSPYRDDTPKTGISTRTYIRNMQALIRHVRSLAR